MPAKTTVTNTGPARFLRYIPPSGLHLNNGQPVEVPGIIDTEIYLGDTNRLTEFLNDLARGWIDVQYTISGISGGGKSTLNKSMKDLNPTPTPGPLPNTYLTSINLVLPPLFKGWAGIYVNGLLGVLGDGVTTKEFFFSGDGGTTARFLSVLQTGDELVFNENAAGFSLDASDRIDVVYADTGA